MNHPQHVIVLMADQLRRDALSCYGDLPVATPHIDAMASECVIFDRAYCSSPLCVPTRISMYTGKWPHTTGAIVNGNGIKNELPYATLPAEHGTLYEHLDAAGYQITHVGVQHVRSHPPLRERVPRAHIESFAEWEAWADQYGITFDIDGLVAEHIRPVPNFDQGKPVAMHFPTPKAIAEFPHEAETYLDLWWAARAEQLIADLDPTTPQFFQALFWAPHPPYVVPEPYFSMYKPDDIDLPETVGVWCPDQPASLLLQTPGVLGAQLSRDEYRAPWSAYFGLVTMVDDCVGRVVRALKAKGIWDDALVIFMLDHGEMLGSHALMQKHCCYEEAVHVALMIKPPGGTKSARRDQLVGHIDFANTICDYAGITPLTGSPGQSLRPIVEDAAAPWRDATFMEYNGDWGRSTPMRAVVADIDGQTFKYIYHFADSDELYNVTGDPLEKTSLAEHPDYQTIRLQLRRRVAQWMAETGDFLKIPD